MIKTINLLPMIKIMDLAQSEDNKKYLMELGYRDI